MSHPLHNCFCDRTMNRKIVSEHYNVPRRCCCPIAPYHASRTGKSCFRLWEVTNSRSYLRRPPSHRVSRYQRQANIHTSPMLLLTQRAALLQGCCHQSPLPPAPCPAPQAVSMTTVHTHNGRHPNTPHNAATLYVNVVGPSHWLCTSYTDSTAGRDRMIS